MQLQRFRVTNFRSVEDSGWIDASRITALIGENESGKTNLLLALWKLNPANGEKIHLLADAPRNRYNELRGAQKKPRFIETVFELSDDLVKKLITLTGAAIEDVRLANIARDLAGGYSVWFPKAKMARDVDPSQVLELINATIKGVEAVEAKSGTDTAYRDESLDALHWSKEFIDSIAKKGENVVASELLEVLTRLSFDEKLVPKRSLVAPQIGELTDQLTAIKDSISKQNPGDSQEARNLVRNSVPQFVYYSDYGNLDSEIYLPHVIDNLKREDLGSKEQAQVRTLRVLFDFVKLQPEEILALGQEPEVAKGGITADQIAESAERKKERRVLLQSASTGLTGSFRSWWKQGDYRIRFDADGNHFRIWVSDDLRTEEIELESRSRGLQWFFSFYLVFLVESEQAHQNTILLLDEPGLSLHPIAQGNLSRFFENLAQTNQLMYTTHSPFLVDPNHLDRVKAVYIDENGKTVASDDLRANEGSAARSIYPVYAALNLSVSDTLLQGCIPVIVEGQSDQIYLSAIKLILLNKGLLKPKAEIIFLSVGGARAASPVISILGGRDEILPTVILDGDKTGLEMAKNLQSNVYRSEPHKVITIDGITGRAGDEIEDIFESKMLARMVARFFPRTDDEFWEILDDSKPFVPQVKDFIKKYNLTLDDGWKVELARQLKERLLASRDSISDDMLTMWQRLFVHL